MPSFVDLREFISELEKRGDLVRITAAVDPNLEMTEIADRTLRGGGPALLFENPKGSDIPVLANLFGSERRVALGCAAGVTTGYCFCGESGCTSRAEYTLHGRRVNLAARLMTRAAAEGTLFSATTRLSSRRGRTARSRRSRRWMWRRSRALPSPSASLPQRCRPTLPARRHGAHRATSTKARRARG